MKIIFRDDDISFRTNLTAFKEVQSLFNEYHVLHTIALVAKDMEKAPALIEYIKQNNVDVQLHCWEHIDFTNSHDVMEEHLTLGIKKIEDIFGKRPTVFYPTWNKVDEKIFSVASYLGLSVSYKKISLSQFIKVKGDVDEDTINFHYWAYEDVMLLEPALKIYKTIYENNRLLPKSGSL